jgi:pyridoxine 5-phosphate synthase
MPRGPRLGLNIDHVATIRNARGGLHPDPVRGALLAAEAGVVDGITAHLREDRRHIRDEDIRALMETVGLPLNLEMAATPEMLEIALRHRPHAACIVPERREERTTEGGLQVAGQVPRLKPMIADLSGAGVRVSLFIEPELAQLDAAVEAGAPVVELHTGAYAEAEEGPARIAQLDRLIKAAEHCVRIGLECHAGHGLTFDNVEPVAAIPTIAELNIGHFLIGEAVFRGLVPTLKEMRRLLDEARA